MQTSTLAVATLATLNITLSGAFDVARQYDDEKGKASENVYQDIVYAFHAGNDKVAVTASIFEQAIIKPEDWKATAQKGRAERFGATLAKDVTNAINVAATCHGAILLCVALLTKDGLPKGKSTLEIDAKNARQSAKKTPAKSAESADDGAAESADDGVKVSDSPAVHAFSVLEFLLSDAGLKVRQETHIASKIRALAALLDNADMQILRTSTGKTLAVQPATM